MGFLKLVTCLWIVLFLNRFVNFADGKVCVEGGRGMVTKLINYCGHQKSMTPKRMLYFPQPKNRI